MKSRKLTEEILISEIAQSIGAKVVNSSTGNQMGKLFASYVDSPRYLSDKENKELHKKIRYCV